jgi:hypothetical protein
VLLKVLIIQIKGLVIRKSLVVPWHYVSILALKNLVTPPKQLLYFYSLMILQMLHLI